MSRPGADELARECLLFCRYLGDVEGTPDIVRAYQRAHEVERLTLDCVTPTDRALLRLAHGGRSFTRFADSFAGAVAPSSALRKKLVVLIAILESRGASAAHVDHATPGSRLAWALTTAAVGVGWLGRVVLGAVLLAPLRLWYGLSSQR